MKKLIVSDIDGTLINDQQKLTAYTRDYLIACQQDGHRLVLCSGRSITRMMDYALELQMDKYQGYLIDVNGTTYYSFKDDKRIRFSSVSEELLSIAFPILKQLDAEIQYFFDHGLYVVMPQHLYEFKLKLRQEMNYPLDFPLTASSTGWIVDLRKGYTDWAIIEDISEIKQVINKIGVNQDPEKIDMLIEQLQQNLTLNQLFEIVRPTPRQIELTPIGTTKGATLKKMIAMENLQPQEVISFGDGGNDISLFENSDVSVAVANGFEATKQAAQYVTLSNQQDGVVHFLKQYLNEK